MPPAQNVKVEVFDGLAAVVACVDYDAEALWQLLPGDLGCFVEEVSQELCGHTQHIPKVLFRDQEQVCRCLRVQVCERERMVILVDSLYGDLVLRDLAEDAIWHGKTTY